MKVRIFFYLFLLVGITFYYTPLTFSKFEISRDTFQSARVATSSIELNQLSSSSVLLDIGSNDAIYDLSFQLNNYTSKNGIAKLSEVDLSYTIQMETSIPYNLLYNGSVSVEASLSPDFSSNLANISWEQNDNNGTTATLNFNPQLSSDAGTQYSKIIYLRFHAKKSAFTLNQNFSIRNLRAIYEQID